jgi:outer membrane protein assembly factor BamA
MILQPAVSIGIFQFPGAEQFAYTRLAQAANFTAQSPYNADEVERDRQSLLTFLRQEGFFQAEVVAETKVDAPHALANVLFRVTLHRHARFGNVAVADTQAEDETKLDASLQTPQS